MKKLILLTFIFIGAVTVNAQECPHSSGCVTISREAAVKMLADSDKVTALEAENAALKQAISDQKDVITNLRVELGKMSGELTGSQQMNVRQTAIIDVLLKSVRPKKIGLINF